MRYWTRIVSAVTLAGCLGVHSLPLAARQGRVPAPPPPSSSSVALTGADWARALEAVDGVPLHFERNDGQADGPVDYLARGAGYAVGLSATQATVTLSAPAGGGSTDAARSTSFRFVLRGGSDQAQPASADRLPGVVNYLKGNDPARWQQGVPTFARVRYAGVYDGIDVVYYGNQKRLQYHFIVAPGADASQIALDVRGAERVSIDAEGDLQLTADGRTLEQEKPFTYQLVDGARREVPSRFALDGTTVRFEVGDYDATRELVIDPVIAYSSWFGGLGEEGILDMAVDVSGNLVVFGFTVDAQATLQFPTTPGAPKTTRGTDPDAFVTKFNPSGSALVFSTLIGGSGNEMDSAYSYEGGLALDAAGNVYITGTTRSANFPVTPGAFDTDYNDDDVGATGSMDGYYLKLSPTGALLYGTYVGGRRTDEPHDIDVDAAGNVYIVGSTDSDQTTLATGGFVIAGDAYDATYGGSNDFFLLRFNTTGQLTYSSYFGTASSDANTASAVRASRTAANVVYVATDTNSTAFPTTPATRFQGFVSGPDIALLRLDLSQAAANQLTYGTYFGGNGVDTVTSMAVDASDRVYIAGATNSSAASLPAAPSAPGSPLPSGTDVLVAKFNTAASGAASLVYGMRINGFYTDTAIDLALDAQDQAWLGIESGSFQSTPTATDFPLKNTLSTRRSGNGVHHAVVQVNAAGNDIVLSSLIGASSGRGGPAAVAVTPAGEVWVGATSGGGTTSLDLLSPFQATYGGGDADATLQRIGKQADLSITKTVDKPYPTVTVLPGENTTYTITVNNPGDTVTNLVVTDPLPSQVSFVSCAATLGGVCGGSGSTRTVTFASLGTGQSGVITLVARVNDDVGPGQVWTNTATFVAGGVTDPDPSNNTGGGGGSAGNGGGGVPVITNPAADADGDGLPNGWERSSA